MKVGMIFECSQKGADGQVYPYLAKHLRPDLEIEPFFLDSKPRLAQQCGSAAEQLLEIDRCERVLIIWDLRPTWPEKRKGLREKLCPVKDCELIRNSLANKLTFKQMQNIRLLSVVHELETLLLIDEQALNSYLNALTGNSYHIGHISHSERRTDPKADLCRIFTDNKCRKYEDWKDAGKIIQLVNINKLRHCPTFLRFEKRIKEL